jgi:hypothetical protein
VEHVITHADQNVELIVEEERKSFDEDQLQERFALHMSSLWQQNNPKKGVKHSHLNRSTIDFTST